MNWSSTPRSSMPACATGWLTFFRKALHREPEQRFGNAYDMQTAWRQVFKESEQRKITTTSGEEIVLGVSLEKPHSEHPVSALGVIARVPAMRSSGRTSSRSSTC